MTRQIKSKKTNATARGKTVKQMHLKTTGGTKRIKQVQTLCRNCSKRVTRDDGWLSNTYTPRGYETSYFCSQECLALWFGESLDGFSFPEDLPEDIRGDDEW